MKISYEKNLKKYNIIIETYQNNVEVEKCLDWLEDNIIYFELEETFNDENSSIITVIKNVKEYDLFSFLLHFS